MEGGLSKDTLYITTTVSILGYGPTASPLYYPHNYGQMRQQTMLHTQQNYNTNYLNNNIGHSRPPIASEPPGKCFNLI